MQLIFYNQHFFRQDTRPFPTLKASVDAITPIYLDACKQYSNYTQHAANTTKSLQIYYPYGMLDPELSPQAYQQLSTSAHPPLLLDVREPWEADAASIPGATLIPMGEITSRAHTELDPDQPIVVLCHHGARSLSVTMWLRNQGFDHAQSLAGGIDHYPRTIDPTVPRY